LIERPVHKQRINIDPGMFSDKAVNQPIEAGKAKCARYLDADRAFEALLALAGWQKACRRKLIPQR
jgi:hypothetical protein